MSSIRQQLIDAITENLRGIRRPDYLTDVGLLVFEHRDPANEPVQPEELPCVCFRDSQVQTTPLTASVHEHQMTLDIWCNDASSVDVPDAPDKLRTLEADVMQALGEDPTFGGLVHFCHPQAGELRTERRGKTVGTIHRVFDVRFRTPAFDAATLHVAPT